MVDSSRQRARKQKAMLVGLVGLGISASLRADDTMSDDLLRCAAIEASTERLACYDALAGRLAPAPAPVSAPSPEPVPVAAKTLDDLGAATLPKSAREEQELAVRAKVTRCEKDARKKYFFVFDNGQVWKQTSDKRLRYKECDFEVTITKDFFGYRMQPDGDKGRIRISRVK